MNSRISPKEWGLIKGALRRVFSRSDLRRQALELSRTNHTDPNRKRVTRWSRCPYCKKHTPTYQMEVDHLLPVIALTESLHDLDANTLVNRIWCDAENLVAICKPCHTEKTRQETKQRAANRKLKRKPTNG